MRLRFQQKLIIPSASRPLVVRDTLIDKLERAICSKRVVALAAPAGWGKTTALAQWASASTMPVAWYTLDAADRDPQLFLDYLLHTIAAFVPEADTILAQLGAIAPDDLPELIRATALAIAAAPAPFGLVFDDFHVLEEPIADPASRSSAHERALLPGTPLVLDLLASIGEYAANCHLVFASRTLPALHGLVRMIAQQRAAVFDYTTLQLSPADVQQLAGVAYHLNLPAERAAQLSVHLGGWVTGIVLSLDQTSGDSQWLAAPPDEVPAPADTSQVYAFFAEQITAPLPPDLYRFLEETSVLEDLSPLHCDMLRCRSDSALFLDEIRRRGLFVSSRAGWLSYHSLFRDFLRTRLQREPKRYHTLLRRAGDLYSEEDDLERAIDCYLTARTEPQAIELLRRAIPQFRRHSRQTTLLACFERLGQDRILPADLLLAQARVYSDLALWERAYLAIQLVETIGDAPARWEAQIIHADLLNLQGNIARARSVLDEIDPAKLPARLHLEYALTAGRIQIIDGQIGAAIESLEQAHALTTMLADAADDPSALADIYDNLGLAYALRGQRDAAMRHLKRADACWQSSGNNGRRALTLNNLGMLALEEERYPEARASLESGLEIAQQTTRRREETVLRCSLAELHLAEGDLDAALLQFSGAHALAVRMELIGSLHSAASGALWVATLQGDSELCRLWHDIAAPAQNSGAPEIRARMALSGCLQLLEQPAVDYTQLAQLAAEAGEQPSSAPERACALLVRALLQFEQRGWPHAQPEWDRFSAGAAALPGALLQRIAKRHPQLFVAAAGSSPLAQSLLADVQPTDQHWKISALGAFSCSAGGSSCDLSPLHRALLVRLLDAGSPGLTVERLWEAVWGDSEVSMPALHQALRRLRVQTGLAVAARDGHVAIRSPWEQIDYDVRSFEQVLGAPATPERLAQALGLYRGDFLSSAPLSAALWADTRRAHLQQRYLDTLEQLAQSAEHDAPHMAIHYYQQVLQIDGCRERTATRLMRLAARFGNRSLVATTFEHLKGSLRILGAAPEPATAALFQQLH